MGFPHDLTADEVAEVIVEATQASATFAAQKFRLSEEDVRRILEAYKTQFAAYKIGDKKDDSHTKQMGTITTKHRKRRESGKSRKRDNRIWGNITKSF